jgi:hypothetical protein
MDRGRTAESLLALVGDPAHAASTVGDLEELASERGPFWFWSNVAGATIFQLGRALRIQPLRLAFLILGGLVLSELWSLAFFAAGAIGSMAMGMGGCG